MAKLYFRYGAVGSAKTLNLLAVAHNYEQQQKRAIIIKPRVDTRFGAATVRSRAGLERTADIVVDTPAGDIVAEVAKFDELDCILVDESQFLDAGAIEQLRDIATSRNVPVICYGLRTDFRGQLFEGARRLMELADAIEEVKTTCHFCNRKAVFNLKVIGGRPTIDGPRIDLGAEEKYLPACAHCYGNQLGHLSWTAR